MNLRTAMLKSWMSSTTVEDPGSAGAGGGEGGAAGGAAAGEGVAGGGKEGGGAGSGGAPLPFYEAFTRAELKTSPTIQVFKTVEDLAFGYENLVKRMGIEPERRLDLPKDMADKEAMKAVWKRLGAPDKAEDYGFKLGDGATKEDMAMVADFAKVAAENGVPREHAGAMMKWWEGKVAEAVKAQTDAFEARRADGETALKKEWGGAFDHRSKEVGRLMADWMGAQKTAEGKAAAQGLIAELDGKLGNYPQLALFMGSLLDKMAEPEAAGGRSGENADPGKGLTPSQAAAAARALDAHPALRDKAHPEHKTVVAKRSELLRQAA